MTVIKSREELYDYLNKVDIESKRETSLSSVYFLVEQNGKDEAIYFMSYNGVYFESPCELHSWEMKDTDLDSYVLDMYMNESFNEAYELEKLMQRDNMHYEIDCPQTGPFLKMPCKIKGLLSESECLDFLLKERN